MVRPPPPRPALARGAARSLPGVDLGNHAPADARGDGAPLLRALPARIPHAWSAWRAPRKPLCWPAGAASDTTPARATCAARRSRSPRPVSRATTTRIRALPGVGPYTAAAIVEHRLRPRHPALDGNVMRVVGARLRRPLRYPLRPHAPPLRGNRPRLARSAPARRGSTRPSWNSAPPSACPANRAAPPARWPRSAARAPKAPPANCPSKARAPEPLRVEAALAVVTRGGRVLLRQRAAGRAQNGRLLGTARAGRPPRAPFRAEHRYCPAHHHASPLHHYGRRRTNFRGSARNALVSNRRISTAFPSAPPPVKPCLLPSCNCFVKAAPIDFPPGNVRVNLVQTGLLRAIMGCNRRNLLG